MTNNTPAVMMGNGGALVGEVAAQFHAMAATIPDFDGGGLDNIIAAVMSAETPEQLDQAWISGGRALPLNTPLTVTRIAKSQSDFADGLGYYLVIDAVNEGTGEAAQYVTGASSIVAQLIKAYVSGWLPLRCVALEAAKPTKDGYKPQHLEVIPFENAKAVGGKRG